MGRRVSGGQAAGVDAPGGERDLTVGAPHSLGTLSLGTLSLGTLSLGTLSLGTLSLGTLSLGTLSLGTLSLGTLSLGTLSSETWRSCRFYRMFGGLIADLSV